MNITHRTPSAHDRAANRAAGVIPAKRPDDHPKYESEVAKRVSKHHLTAHGTGRPCAFKVAICMIFADGRERTYRDVAYALAPKGFKSATSINKAMVDLRKMGLLKAERGAQTRTLLWSRNDT